MNASEKRIVDCFHEENWVFMSLATSSENLKMVQLAVERLIGPECISEAISVDFANSYTKNVAKINILSLKKRMVSKTFVNIMLQELRFTEFVSENRDCVVFADSPREKECCVDLYLSVQSGDFWDSSAKDN